MNGWQRIGIVLSVIWMMGSAYPAYYYFSHPARPWENDPIVSDIRLSAGAIMDDNFGFVPDSPGQSDWVPVFPSYHPVQSSAEAIILPPIIAWIIIYILVWTLAWIRAGFKKGESDGMA